MAIDIKQAIEIIDLGEWMSMEVLAANINKGTGGRLFVLSKCRLAKSRAGRKALIGASVERKTKVKLRDPNSNENFTRQIELPNKSIMTIHVITIMQINNQNLL